MRSGSKVSGVEVSQCNPFSLSSCQQVNVSVSSDLGQVILSAGSLSTPKLLYFSGIGPDDILTRLGGAGQLFMPSSDWIVNENVGRGLYDNPNTFLMLQSPDVQAYAFGYNGTGIGVTPSDLAAYRNHRSGPYASSGQTTVFWDGVQSSDGRTVGVSILVRALVNHVDARYCFFVRVRRLSMPRLLHPQHLWHLRTSISWSS